MQAIVADFLCHHSNFYDMQWLICILYHKYLIGTLFEIINLNIHIMYVLVMHNLEN